MNRNSALCATLLIVAAGGHAAAQQSAGQRESGQQGAGEQGSGREVLYRTKLHDTLYDLARRYMVRQSDYLTVQTLNHVRTPEHLPPNLQLRIPVALLKSELVTAQVVSFRGDVRIGEDRRAPQVGATLAEGARLETGPGAFLTIKAVDGSIIVMPSQSVMRLARMRRMLLTGGIDQEFAVERGHIQTEVMPQTNPNSHYQFRTPIAVSAVRGTVFRVAYGDGPSITEVLGGIVVVGRPGAGKPVPVPKGMGAAVSASGEIATEVLLPPPALMVPDAVLSSRNVHFAFAPVAGAVRYHAQISLDAPFHNVVDEVITPSPEANFAKLANGHYFLRATAISAKGFEGLPAIYPVDRKLVIIEGAVTRLNRREYSFNWQYNGDPAEHYRFQLDPVGNGAIGLLDQPNLRGTTLVLDDFAPGTYRWRVGAVVARADGSRDIIWTPFSPVRLTRPGF